MVRSAGLIFYVEHVPRSARPALNKDDGPGLGGGALAVGPDGWFSWAYFYVEHVPRSARAALNKVKILVSGAAYWPSGLMACSAGGLIFTLSTCLAARGLRSTR